MPIFPFPDHSQLTTAEIDWVQNAAGLTYAKGTILVADGSGDLNALALGTNTHVLTADSTQTLGIKWSTAAAGGDVTGPGSAVDENITVFDSTTGKLIKDSTVNISAVNANTDKVTNATHTGDVTGATALTIGENKVNDTHIDWGTGANQVSAVDILIADATDYFVGTETETALSELGRDNAYLFSPSVITGGAITDGTNAGTFKVAALTALFRTTDSVTAPLKYASLAEQDNQAITVADTTYFISLNYNGGSPTITLSETNPYGSGAADYRSIPIGKVMKDGSNNVHYIDGEFYFQDGTRKMHNRAKDLRAIELASGGTIAYSGTNNFTMTEAIIYSGIVKLTRSAYDSAVTQFTPIYSDGGAGYTEGADRNTIDYTHYDDGDGTLGNIGVAKYGTFWVYSHVDDGHVYVRYGLGSYSLADAETEGEPPKPDHLTDFGLLIGKIVAPQAGGSFTTIQMVSDTFFSGTSVSDHNQLGNLQGGTADEYYHLTSAQHTIATQAATTDVSGYLATADWDTFNNKQAQGDVLDDFNTLGAVASDGQVIVGTAAGVFAYESGDTLRTSLGLGATDNPDFGRYSIFTYQNDTYNVAPFLRFNRAKLTGADVVDDNYLGEIRFYGMSNGAYQFGATIGASADGTPGGSATDMPSDLFFATSADGSATPTTRLTIGSDGVSTFAGTVALGANNLTMSGSIGITGTRVTKGWFTDLEVTNAPTLNGVAIPSISSTSTLTNKRITDRVVTFASDATPDVNSDSYDAVTITAQAAAITDVNVTGTPTNFQKLIFRIKDNGTARAITWGNDFEAKGVALPTTTSISKVLTTGFIYDTVTSKWGCVASVEEE